MELAGSAAAIQDAGRRFARRHVESLDQYSKLLSGYGEGKITPTAFGRGLLDLAIAETARYAADVADLGTQYWNWVMGRPSEASPRRPSQKRASSRRRARKTTSGR
jgi:hypothetical protein